MTRVAVGLASAGWLVYETAMRFRFSGLVPLLLLGACSSGGYEPRDGALPADLSADLITTADLGTRTDAASGGCVTTFACDARTAEHGCGVTTASGQRHPDQGAPYCSERGTRQGCSCDLVRCTSPAPLCPGTYQAVFNERILAGCAGIPNGLDGTCHALWNTVKSVASGAVLADRTMLNVYLDWAFTDYQQSFMLTEPAVVSLTVQQSCWFADVSGSGNSGRSEVSKITVLAQP